MLVLHSYHKGLRWTDAEDAGISSVLGARPELDVHTEYLDTKRHPEDAYQRTLLALYRTKFPGIPFAAVLATDDAAYAFAVANRELLFPHAAVAVLRGEQLYRPGGRPAAGRRHGRARGFRHPEHPPCGAVPPEGREPGRRDQRPHRAIAPAP